MRNLLLPTMLHYYMQGRMVCGGEFIQGPLHPHAALPQQCKSLNHGIAILIISAVLLALQKWQIADSLARWATLFLTVFFQKMLQDRANDVRLILSFIRP